MNAIFTAAHTHLAEGGARLSFTKMNDKRVLSEFGKHIDDFVHAVGALGHPIKPERAGDPKTKVAILRAYAEYVKVVQAVRVETIAHVASAHASEELAEEYDLTRKEFFVDYMGPLVANRSGKLDAPVDALFDAFVTDCRRPATDVFRDIFQNLGDEPALGENDANALAPVAPVAPVAPDTPDTPMRAPAIVYDDASFSGFQKRMMFIRGVVS